MILGFKVICLKVIFLYATFQGWFVCSIFSLMMVDVAHGGCTGKSMRSLCGENVVLGSIKFED